MIRRRAGRVLNVASIGGKVAVPHLLPYSAGKFALVGLSHGLRTELAGKGVTVTVVCPGLMRTGSHLNAEFKGQADREYAWFALGNGLPGLSMGADTAARKILDACAAGDAEAVLGLPAKAAVMAQGVAPNLTAAVLTASTAGCCPSRPASAPTSPRGGTAVARCRRYSPPSPTGPPPPTTSCTRLSNSPDPRTPFVSSSHIGNQYDARPVRAAVQEQGRPRPAAGHALRPAAARRR